MFIDIHVWGGGNGGGGGVIYRILKSEFVSLDL